MKSDDLFFKLIPLTTGFLIIAGILNAVGYYIIFQFPIVEYLDFSEIIVLFLNDLLFLGILFISLITGAIIAFQKVPFVRSALTSEEPPKLSIKSHQLLMKLNRISRFVMPICVCAGIICMGYLIFYAESNVATLIIYLSVFLIIGISTTFLSPLLDTLYEGIVGVKINKLYSHVLQIVFAYLLSAFIVGLSKGMVTQNRSGYARSVVIHLKNASHVSTNDSLICIGRSRNYTFLYNRNSGEKTILSNDEISSIKIK